MRDIKLGRKTSNKGELAESLSPNNKYCLISYKRWQQYLLLGTWECASGRVEKTQKVQSRLCLWGVLQYFDRTDFVYVVGATAWREYIHANESHELHEWVNIRGCQQNTEYSLWMSRGLRRGAWGILRPILAVNRMIIRNEYFVY